MALTSHNNVFVYQINDSAFIFFTVSTNFTNQIMMTNYVIFAEIHVFETSGRFIEVARPVACGSTRNFFPFSNT